MIRTLFALFSALLVAGCIPDFDPADGPYACESDSDCVDDYTCQTNDDLGRKVCEPSSTQAPLTASEPTDTP